MEPTIHYETKRTRKGGVHTLEYIDFEFYLAGHVFRATGSVEPADPTVGIFNETVADVDIHGCQISFLESVTDDEWDYITRVAEEALSVARVNEAEAWERENPDDEVP